MAITKSYTIPTQHVAELVEVFGESYQTEIDGEPNPQTKVQFASEVFDSEIISHVRYRVVNYRRKQMPEVDKSDIIEVV